jgi:NADPH-dependent 2,4-dienoyl-CoA reductase/sulfur reductase-like enzyme/nitrite reductase/ring-hydroxylating ferredoxin subunit
MAGHDDGDDKGPDLARGVAPSDIPENGLLQGHVGEDGVVLARVGSEFLAIGSACTHYSGPLAQGLRDGDTVFCPWHHACFSLRTGEALRAPALAPVACWTVEQRDGKIFVTAKKDEAPARQRKPAGAEPSAVVIVGGGAAGFAAAEMLRRMKFSGRITMLSDDGDAPVDRPNLSKDYLAGTAPEDWIPLRPDDWYRDNGIDLRLNTKVTAVDVRAREVHTGGDTFRYDRLLLATGAEPIRLAVPGGDLPHVHTLRTLRDARAIIKAAQGARRVVVIGASFIGLEVAASLRARKLEVAAVAPEQRPLEKVFGPEMGDFVRGLHEENGVVFHLGETAAAIEERQVVLKSGRRLDADLVIIGIGVRPRIALAEAAGLKADKGVSVNTYLETSVPDVFAAGDIARFPDHRSGENIRVEHWVVAERLGQVAARNILGAQERYIDTPFFWTQHYDQPISYAGHASAWDRIEIDGKIADRDCVLHYHNGGKVLAIATMGRDRDNLKIARAFERA